MTIPPATADTVYQIISGFYPEITSGPAASAKEKGGTGSVGAKYKLVSGWNDAAIARTKFMEEAEGKDKQQFAKETYLKEHKAATAWGKLTPKERKEAIKGGQKAPGKRTVKKGVQKSWKTKAHEEAGEYPDIKRGGVLVGELRDYYKWSGGSDQYKLYGDMVWYMHAKRNIKDIEDYVAGFGKATPKFNSIYANSQGNLAKTAKKMAQDIFDDAVDSVGKKLIQEEVDIWNMDQQWTPPGKEKQGYHMSPEEMGFTVKVGNTQYMATPEAAKTYDKNLKVAEGSLANVRDMVKVVDGKVVEVIDVTEEAITKAGQHGIVDGTEEFDNLVKVIEKFKTDPKGLSKIKEAVVAMFLKNIEQYNPIIEKLQSYASSEADKSDKTFEQILKKIKEGAKKEGKIGTPDIAKEVGFVYREAAAQKQGKEVVDKVAMEYVVHMLATMGGLQGAKFKQTHRVADYPSTHELYGQSLYAIVPMEQDPKKLIFLEPPVKKTVILAGYSATLAMAVKYDKMKPHQALEESRAQKQAWQYSRVTKGTQPKAGARYTSAENSLRNSAKHSTSVSSIAGPKLQELLLSVVAGLSSGKFTSRVQDGKKVGVQPNLDKSTYYWNPGQGKMGGSGKRATRLRKGKGMGGTMFWALPYIGIQQSEYTGKQ